MASNATIGNCILSVSLALFAYFVFWIAVLPFMRIDDDNWIHAHFAPLKYAFILPVSFGTLVLGFLIAFVVYHTGEVPNFFA